MSAWIGRSESAVNAVWRLLLRLALIGGILYACYRLRNVITTLFVAAIIGYVLDPIVEWLCHKPGFVQFHSDLANLGARLQVWYCRLLFGQTLPPTRRQRLRRHVVRLYATIYVFILAICVLWQGTRLVVTPFIAEFRNATSPDGRKQAMEGKKKFLKWYNQTAPDWAQSDKVKEMVLKSDASKAVQRMAADLGARLLESLKNIVEIVLLPVLAFYFLIDGRHLKHEFISLLPRAHIRESLRLVNEFNRIMRAFVAGQFILCVLAGIVVGVGLAALGVKYPIILGMWGGLTRAIPIIGPIVGGIPIILLTLVTKGFGVALGVLAFFTFLHFAESKFVMPLLIGDRMELHPVIIILVLLVGGELGGVLIGGQIGALLGMFFAAPVAALVRVMVRRYWLRVRPGKASRRPLSSPPAETALARIPEAVE